MISIEGAELGSYPSLGDIALRTNGRMNPTRTVEKVCIPGDPTKKSISRPVMKDKVSSKPRRYFNRQQKNE